jgi:DNA-binding CsgD family transcriptional regulator
MVRISQGRQWIGNIGNNAPRGSAVNKNSPDKATSRTIAPVVPFDKLTNLLTSFTYLRSSHRALVQTLHGSIHELRELRRSLQTRHPKNFAPRASDPRASDAREIELARRFGLTRREIQVATLLAQGRSNQAIARELKISAHTARHHTQRVLSKLQVHSRGEAGAKIRG